MWSSTKSSNAMREGKLWTSIKKGQVSYEIMNPMMGS